LWLHSLKVAQLLRSAACLHTNQSRSYLNHLVEAQIFFPKLSPNSLNDFVFIACPPPTTLTFKVIYLTSIGLSNSQNKQQLFAPNTINWLAFVKATACFL